MMEFKDYNKLFETDEQGSWMIQLKKYGKPWEKEIDVEELYQHFMHRYDDEIYKRKT